MYVFAIRTQIQDVLKFECKMKDCQIIALKAFCSQMSAIFSQYVLLSCWKTSATEISDVKPPMDHQQLLM